MLKYLLKQFPMHEDFNVYTKATFKKKRMTLDLIQNIKSIIIKM